MTHAWTDKQTDRINIANTRLALRAIAHNKIEVNYQRQQKCHIHVSAESFHAVTRAVVASLPSADGVSPGTGLKVHSLQLLSPLTEQSTYNPTFQIITRRSIQNRTTFRDNGIYCF